MASIQKRITKEGRTTYRALIRIKGCPTRSATFDKRSDACRWSQEQEVDRYVSQVMPDKKDIAIQTHQLNWWKTKLGDYRLSEVSSAMISECRDALKKGQTQYGTLRDQLLRSTGILQYSVMPLRLPGKNGTGSILIQC